MNIYQSIHSNSQQFNNLLLQPFFEDIKGVTNQAISLISKETIASIPRNLENSDTKRAVIVLTVLCSFVITILLISRCIFRIDHSSSHPSDAVSKDGIAGTDDTNDTDDTIDIDDPKIKVAGHAKVKGHAIDKSIYNESKDLAKNGDFPSAWASYCYESYFDVYGTYPEDKESYQKQTCSLKSWIELPSEELISGFTKTLSTDQILKLMPIELLRDCLIAYPHFLENQKMYAPSWLCFRAYTSYIIDICKASPLSGQRFVLEGIDNYIEPYFMNEQLLLELFQAIYPNLLTYIKEKGLTDDQTGNLNYFLAALQNPRDEERSQIEQIKMLIDFQPSVADAVII